MSQEKPPRIKKVKRVVKNVKKKAWFVFRAWQVITTIIVFAILVPTFLHANDEPLFYKVVFTLTALVIGLIIIIREPLKKSLRKYVDKAVFAFIVGALLLLVTDFFIPIGYVQDAFFILSASAYSIGIQRLGIRYLFGII